MNKLCFEEMVIMAISFFAFYADEYRISHLFPNDYLYGKIIDGEGC